VDVRVGIRSISSAIAVGLSLLPAGEAMGQGTIKLESGLEVLSGVEVFVNASGGRESLGVTDEKGELTTTTDLPDGVTYDTYVRLCDGKVISVELVFEGQRHPQEAPTLGCECRDGRFIGLWFDETVNLVRLPRTAVQPATMTPSEVARAAILAAIQDGAGEFHVQVPGTEIIARGDDTPEGGLAPPGGLPPGEELPPPEEEEPPPTEELPPPEEEELPPPGEDPRDKRPPTIYGEELCDALDVRGQFEPAQGVWQDDPTFADRRGKQILKVSPVLWEAELPMVTNRKSLLFGIERAVGGSESRRNEIFIKGRASGTLVPVFFRFTLKQEGAQKVIYESDIVGEVPLGGPCGPDPKDFEVVLDASDGIPQEFTFEFEKDGTYEIDAELVTGDGRPTGIKVTVEGESVSTHAPTLAFRPITILATSLREDRRSRLEETAQALRVNSALHIPDLFPIENVPLTTNLFPLQERGDLLERVVSRRGREVRLIDLIERLGTDPSEENRIREELLRELNVVALMGGYDRLVVLVTDQDFRLLRTGTLDHDDSAAFTPGQKVIFVNLETGANPWTVAHELAHTIRYIFADPTMISECGLNYHNTDDPVGHGHQITEEGLPSRSRRDGSRHLMGPSGIEKWIEQCTYVHVLEILTEGIPDPRVLLVQGFIARDGGRSAGVLLPFYDLDGIVDLPAGGTGSWGIVLRDAEGGMLARHAWDPQWRIPDIEVERSLMAFAFRVPWIEGLARVDLEGPDGPLDSRTLSATAPVVTIVSPVEGAPALIEEGGVRVAWSGTDADGDSLLYTVLYSSDEGETWMDVAVEIAETSVMAPVDPEAPRDAHRVLVRATDGGRSSDVVRAIQPVTAGE
jgi:hypothetical protein